MIALMFLSGFEKENTELREEEINQRVLYEVSGVQWGIEGLEALEPMVMLLLQK